jgi:hypothetical protein
MTRVKSRGHIIPSFWIKCGAQFCDKATTAWVDNIEAAALAFTSRGWGESAVGWVCPECNQKLNADPELLIPTLKPLARSQLTRLRLEFSSEVATAKFNGNTRVLAGAMARLKAVEDELMARALGRSEEFT